MDDYEHFEVEYAGILAELNGPEIILLQTD